MSYSFLGQSLDKSCRVMDYDEAIMLISHLKDPIITVLNTLSLSLLNITILLVAIWTMLH